MTGLVLGPLLRHVDEHAASLWVETDGPARVTVTAGDGVRGEAPTFAVHGHHYALVCVDGLEPGTHYPYTVAGRRRAGVAPSRAPSCRRR